jgi:hypothetical protein
MAKKPETVPLLVTTAKGVFFGYGYGQPTTAKIIRIARARMCVYWAAECKGVLGLAAAGPTANCKIGPAVPTLTIQDVTAVAECSPEAAKKWEEGPWR